MSEQRIGSLVIKSAEQSHREQLSADPLRDFYVPWDEVDAADVAALEQALAKANTEPDMQRYLQANPALLIQHLGGGHGRWVLPQKRLGTKHVTDFVIGDRDSMGRQWMAVELEGPQRPMFNRKGDPSQWLWHAIRQIIDWRVWLEEHRAYAIAAPDDGGLGLEDVSPSFPGLIVIGRRSEANERRGSFRRALGRQLDIEIHSYDWLVDKAAGRVASLTRRG